MSTCDTPALCRLCPSCSRCLACEICKCSPGAAERYDKERHAQPTLTERARLIEEHVKRAIGATALRFEYRIREAYDGEGQDILGDFVVSWENPEALRQERRWGTHTGVIRHKNGETVSVSIFWGHYDMEEEKAKDEYAEKVRRLRPRWD